MDRWQVDDLLLLADALATADCRSFTVRRTFARLESGEITPREAALILSKRGDGETLTPRK